MIPFWFHSDWKCPISYSPKRTKGLILQYDPTAGLWTLQPVLSRDKVPGGPPDNDNNNNKDKKKKKKNKKNKNKNKKKKNKKKKATWLWCGEVCALTKIIADSSKVHQISMGKPQPAVHGRYLERVLVQPIWETGTTQERLPKKLASYEVKNKIFAANTFLIPNPLLVHCLISTLSLSTSIRTAWGPNRSWSRSWMPSMRSTCSRASAATMSKWYLWQVQLAEAAKDPRIFRSPLGHDAKCKREGDDKILHVINAIEWSFRFWSRCM